MGYKRKKVCGLDPEFGAIFMSNTRTKEECIDKQLFGLPSIHCEFVRKVKVGTILFLFEYENRKLHGVFEAVSDGEVNIVPSAYRYTTGISFPAQVRVRRIAHCLPLSEHEFSAVIKDNYYSLKKFNFGLSKHQVQELLFLFKLRKVEESSKDSREKNVMTQGVMSSQRKMQRHPSDDDTATKAKLGSLMMEYSDKIIVPPQEVVSQLGGECQLSCCFPRSSKNQLWTSSQSHQIQDEYYTTDGCKCCECETLLMDDGCPPDDDFGDFIPLPNSSDEEDNYHPAEEKEEVDARDQTGYAKNCVFYGGRNEYLSNVLSTRSMPSFGGETNQLIGTTSQMFTDKEKSWIVGESVNFATARSNNNRLVSSNSPATICPDDSNMTCATASSKNVLLGNNVKGGLYCGTPKPRRTSVFSRLNWRTTPQDQEIRARADQYVDEITQELQNKYDFGEEMLQQMKRQKFTASEIVDKEEQITLHPNPDPSKGGSSVFQRLGKRVGGSRLETL